MNFKSILVMIALLGALPAEAENLGGYAGAGLGVPAISSTSGLAVKIFGGYKLHDFSIGKAGMLQLYIQGEYVDFGKTTVGTTSWADSGMAVAGVGAWVIPRKWAEWTDEKVAVIVKVGGSRVSSKSSNAVFSATYTGMTQGAGAEYRLNNSAAARAMIEQYPNGNQLVTVTGVFSF